MDRSQALLKLAEADLAIGRLERQLDELPEKTAILELRHKLRDVETLMDKARLFVDQQQAALRRLEDEGALLEEHIRSEQAKVSSGAVTNHKELQNLTRELDSLRRQKDAKDSATIEQMERLEAGEAQATKITHSLAKAREKEARLIAQFQERGGALRVELDALARERAALVATIGPELTLQYEETRAVKHGIAVGMLDGSTCSVCRIELPAERTQALREHASRTGDPIAQCPSCKRILVIPEGTP